MEKKFLIVIVGPTAVGKTALGIEVARHLDTVILSADSRQFYKEMDIGTAKPTPEEKAQVPHYFVDSLHIEEDYNVGKYENEALTLLAKLFVNHRAVVMVGGSGLYVKAVCEGIDEMPEIDPTIRTRLNQEHEKYGLETLVNRLKDQDPEYAEIVDLNNPQRVIRALEVIESSGQTYTSYRNAKTTVERPFEIIKIGLEMPRDQLYSRIDKRMDLMIEAGLFEEAESLYEKRYLNALQTVGYSEIFGFLDKAYDKEEAIRLLKRNSRRYAKRQLTWFKKDAAINWFSTDHSNDILGWLSNQLDIEDVN
ncbi:MAG: tRNA (adenosine(37)-N6)-dimethylallyltransferase MiaA [Bacteroidota bacterium]